MLSDVAGRAAEKTLAARKSNEKQARRSAIIVLNIDPPITVVKNDDFEQACRDCRFFLVFYFDSFNVKRM